MVGKGKGVRLGGCMPFLPFRLSYLDVVLVPPFSHGQNASETAQGILSRFLGLRGIGVFNAWQKEHEGQLTQNTKSQE